MDNWFWEKLRRTHNGKWTVSSIISIGKIEYPHTEIKLYPYVSNVQKSTQMDKRFKCKTWNCKATKRKCRGSSMIPFWAVVFLNITPEAQTKSKNWNYIKLKSFCRKRKQLTKRQPTKWEKIFISCLYDSRLISRIYKELTNNKFKSYTQ